MVFFVDVGKQLKKYDIFCFHIINAHTLWIHWGKIMTTWLSDSDLDFLEAMANIHSSMK